VLGRDRVTALGDIVVDVEPGVSVAIVGKSDACTLTLRRGANRRQPTVPFVSTRRHWWPAG